MCLAEDCECEYLKSRSLVKTLIKESNRVYKKMKEENKKMASYIAIPIEKKIKDAG